MENNNLTININLDNLKEEERAKLLEIIENANKCKPKSKVWKPENNEHYYFIGANGSVDRFYYDDRNTYDDAKYAIGNCYKTKEEAEFAAEAYKVYVELKRYAEEHNDTEIDWTTVNTKVVIAYRHNLKMIHYVCTHNIQDIGQIYFSSEKIAMQAVEEIGEDRIKKYLFRVE